MEKFQDDFRVLFVLGGVVKRRDNPLKGHLGDSWENVWIVIKNLPRGILVIHNNCNGERKSNL